MGYKLTYTKTALGDIKKLDSITKKRLGKKLQEFCLNPLLYATRLTNSQIGSYRWRVGNYRVVFDMYKKDIVILRIGHRKEIYKK
ncbi:MAG: type II toxin-antitoxin system RelE family toxin [Candidatus Roizmanbacteria bacterium]